MEEYKPAPIGHVYEFTSKEGGGSYTVIGHVECERCHTLCEEREWTDPSRKHRKKGYFYSQYHWCPKCGLYAPNLSSKEILKARDRGDYGDINMANDMYDGDGEMIEISDED